MTPSKRAARCALRREDLRGTSMALGGRRAADPPRRALERDAAAARAHGDAAKAENGAGSGAEPRRRSDPRRHCARGPGRHALCRPEERIRPPVCQLRATKRCACRSAGFAAIAVLLTIALRSPRRVAEHLAAAGRRHASGSCRASPPAGGNSPSCTWSACCC
ncbi:hypothetical protein ACU4GD_10900 [Cupriavidus basilensis]